MGSYEASDMCGVCPRHFVRGCTGVDECCPRRNRFGRVMCRWPGGRGEGIQEVRVLTECIGCGSKHRTAKSLGEPQRCWRCNTVVCMSCAITCGQCRKKCCVSTWSYRQKRKSANNVMYWMDWFSTCYWYARW